MEDKIRKLISQMTLEEKASLCSGSDFWHTQGIERLEIPKMMMSDGPHGIRKQAGEADHIGLNESVEAVCFPAACATASSFDVELMEYMGKVLGEECQAENLGVLLGPAVNIKRSPLCGRNFEYLSEDPFLTGKMSAAYIRGVQSWDVGTSIKHFAVNNQEYRRMSCSSELSERTLREIYLPAFEEAIKSAQPKTVMCSYNKINGEYASESEKMLNDILRTEWGFDGYVVTDWGAVADRVKGMKSGLDLEMPASNGQNDARIVQAVKDGILEESVLDLTISRILKVVMSYTQHRHPEAEFNRDKDHNKAVDIETECAVLLENNGILPLEKVSKVAYIGEFAKLPRYQGGGSSHINASKVISALDAAKIKNRSVCYAKGFSASCDERNDMYFQEAIKLAKESDVAVIFAGLPDVFESEGYDRKNMNLPECQNQLIEEIKKVQQNVVVVLHNGSPVEAPWANRVDAILEMYLGGQGVGEACDRVLYGEANPCGRLAETFPMKMEDNPSYLNFPGDGQKVFYSEGVFVGYRYYDTKKIPVRWAFGHGLSYTEFTYSNLTCSKTQMFDDDVVQVSVDVTNNGTRKGKEVVQLYVSDENHTPNRPYKELKGFAKVELNSGETKTIIMEIDARSLSYYNEELHDWYAPSGTYMIQVGHASDNIVLTKKIIFTTAKELPFKVDGATTIGDLLKNPHTSQGMAQILAMINQTDSADGKNSVTISESEQDTTMMDALLDGMPLKSLISFGVTGEQIQQIIYQMNTLLS